MQPAVNVTDQSAQTLWIDTMEGELPDFAASAQASQWLEAVGFATSITPTSESIPRLDQ